MVKERNLFDHFLCYRIDANRLIKSVSLIAAGLLNCRSSSVFGMSNSLVVVSTEIPALIFLNDT